VLSNAVGLAEALHVQVSDCTTAYRATGANVELRLWQGSADRRVGEAMTTAYEALAGAKITANRSTTRGTAAGHIVTGYRCDGAGSVMLINSIEADWVDEVFVSDNGGDLQIWSGSIKNYVYSLQTNNSSILHAFAIENDGSGTFDLWIRNAGDTFHGNGNEIRADKMSLAAGALVLSSAISFVVGDTGHVILGELSVGSPGNPAESVFGEGDSHVRGMSVFRNTNLEIGAWSDITTEMASKTGSTADAFSALTVGAALYIGGDEKEFPNLKIDTTAAIVLGAGALVWEFSTGAGWTAFLLMAADSVMPYNSYAQDVFGRIAFEQVRFGTQDMGTWATQAVNGVTKFWVRARVITAAITTAPTLQQIKLGTNRTEINADGVVEHYGTGELIKDLTWHQRLVNDLVGAASGNSNILLSPSITLSLIDNQFSNNNVDGVGGIVEVPEGLDTSRPLTMLFRWIPTASPGNVEFSSNFAPVSIGDLLDGSLAETLQAQVVAAPAVDTLVENSFDFDISSLTAGDLVAFSLFRDATGGNDPPDTLAGNVEIVMMHVEGTFWR
jgi:hypothetical protein